MVTAVVIVVFTLVIRCLTPREIGGLGSLKLPLLADFSKKMARDFGVLVEDEGIALRYALQVEVIRRYFNGLTCRGLFIISDKGIVRHASVNDVEVGRSIDEIYRLVLGFRYTDKHGEGKLVELVVW